MMVGQQVSERLSITIFNKTFDLTCNEVFFPLYVINFVYDACRAHDEVLRDFTFCFSAQSDLGPPLYVNFITTGLAYFVLAVMGLFFDLSTILSSLKQRHVLDSPTNALKGESTSVHDGNQSSSINYNKIMVRWNKFVSLETVTNC